MTRVAAPVLSLTFKITIHWVRGELGLRLRSDPETSEARLYLTRPFWRHHRLSTTIATYFTRRTEYYQTSPTDRLGVSIQQDLPLRSKWLLSYGYRFENSVALSPILQPLTLQRTLCR